jgi:uroporphyrin-III C-methyltransferase
MTQGKVYLIGAGPGDPELLTLKAVKALRLAKVVLIDDLVNRETLMHAPQARVIEVGKRGGCQSTPQSFINKLMISLAEQGQTVARLKGGDPFIFGRGGEEMMALREAGVPVEIISGITSSTGATAVLGIPLTHRGYTHGVTFVTGHTQDGSPIDWQALVASGTTLVIYMGMNHLVEIVQHLLSAGLPPTTFAAAIQHGTLDIQRQVMSPINMLPMAVKQENLGSPAVIVIGDVVKLTESEAFFNARAIAA